MSDPARGLRGDAPGVSRWLLVALGVAAALSSWTLAALTPTGGLDGSWQAGLVMAFERGLRYGPEIDFTFGPLGFLTLPYLYAPRLGAVAWLLTSGIHVLLCVAIALRAGRLGDGRRASWPVAVGLTAVGAVASSFLTAPGALACLLILLLMARLEGSARGPSGRVAIGRGRRRGGPSVPAEERTELAIVAGVAAICALASLTKLSDALVIGTIGVALAAGGPAHGRAGRVRALATFGVVFVAVFGAAWTLTGQRLGDLGEWLRASIELVGGYSGAMGLPTPEGRGDQSRTVHAVALAITAVIALVALVRVTTGWRVASRSAVFLAGAAFWFVGYKDGIVRHGPGELFAGLLIVVVFAPSWPVTETRLRAVALAAIGVAFLVSRPIDPADLNPLARASNAADQVLTLLDTDRRVATIEDARAEMRAAYAIPPAMLERIGDGSVHVAPYDAAVIWAHPALDWSPLPVFQVYSAFTAYLDDLDADRLASAEGPDFVLRRSNAVIDKRLEWYEAPRTMLALACSFEEVLSDRTWQLLARREDRCSAPESLGGVTVRPGELVTVPTRPGEDAIVVAHVRGLGADPVERLRTLLVRGSTWTIRLTDGGFYRLVPGTADGPLIVSTPPGLVFDPPHGPPSPPSFAVSVGNAVGTSYDPAPDVTLTIEFEAIRIAP